MGVSLSKISGTRPLQGCLDIQYVVEPAKQGQQQKQNSPIKRAPPVTVLQVTSEPEVSMVLQCDQCLLEAQQGSLTSFASVFSGTIEDPICSSRQSDRSLEHTHTADWSDRGRRDEMVCAACCSSSSVSAIYAEDLEVEEDSLVVEIHHGGASRRRSSSSAEEADNVAGVLPNDFIENR